MGTSMINSLKPALLATAAAAALSLGACSQTGDIKPTTGKTDIASTAKLFSGPSPLNNDYRYQGGIDADVKATFTSLLDGMDGKFSYANATTDDASGALVITDVASKEDGGVFSIGRLELYGLKQANLDLLKAKDTSDLVELFDRVRIYDLSIALGTDAGANDISIGAMEFLNFKLSPTMGDKGGDRAGKNDEDHHHARGGAKFAQALKGFEFAGFNVKDMKVSFAQEGMDLDMSVADMRLGEIANGSIGPMAMFDLDYTVHQSAENRAELAELAGPLAGLLNGPLGEFISPENTRVVGKSMIWQGASIEGLLPYLESGERPPANAANLISFGAMEAKDMTSYVDGKLAGTIDLSVLDAIDFAWLIPTRINSYNKGETYHLSAYVPDGQDAIMKVLTDAGAETITGESNFLWEYDDKKGAAKFDISGNMPGFADIDFGFNTSGTPLEPILAAMDAKQGQPNSGNMPSGFESAAFDGFSFTLKDEKLLDVLFGFAGIQMGQDAAQVRQMAPAFLAMGGAQLKELTPRATGYISALSGFITEGGTLSITMTPSQPVGLEMLTTMEDDPAALIELVNLQVTHSQ